MDELELKYEKLKEMYQEIQEEYSELAIKFQQEKNQNDRLIDDMIKITENTKNMSADLLKLLGENESLKKVHKHGLVLEFEDKKEFIPILGDVMKYSYMKPVSAKYTFSPEEMKKWFKEVEYLMEENIDKKNKLLQEIMEL